MVAIIAATSGWKGIHYPHLSVDGFDHYSHIMLEKHSLSSSLCGLLQSSQPHQAGKPFIILISLWLVSIITATSGWKDIHYTHLSVDGFDHYSHIMLERHSLSTSLCGWLRSLQPHQAGKAFIFLIFLWMVSIITATSCLKGFHYPHLFVDYYNHYSHIRLERHSLSSSSCGWFRSSQPHQAGKTFIILISR